MNNEKKNIPSRAPKNPDQERWLAEFAHIPDEIALLKNELDSVEERLHWPADYGHFAVSQQRTKSVLQFIYESRQKLRILVPLDDKYMPHKASKD